MTNITDCEGDCGKRESSRGQRCVRLQIECVIYECAYAGITYFFTFHHSFPKHNYSVYDVASCHSIKSECSRMILPMWLTRADELRFSIVVRSSIYLRSTSLNGCFLITRSMRFMQLCSCSQRSEISCSWSGIGQKWFSECTLLMGLTL